MSIHFIQHALAEKVFILVPILLEILYCRFLEVQHQLSMAEKVGEILEKLILIFNHQITGTREEI